MVPAVPRRCAAHPVRAPAWHARSRLPHRRLWRGLADGTGPSWPGHAAGHHPAGGGRGHPGHRGRVGTGRGLAAGDAALAARRRRRPGWLWPPARPTAGCSRCPASGRGLPPRSDSGPAATPTRSASATTTCPRWSAGPWPGGSSTTPACSGCWPRTPGTGTGRPGSSSSAAHSRHGADPGWPSGSIGPSSQRRAGMPAPSRLGWSP
jgi:hypothetical protein